MIDIMRIKLLLESNASLRGINGPLEWHEFSCVITIPNNITKIRPVLNAGWSSDGKNEATTWFDGINILASVPT